MSSRVLHTGREPAAGSPASDRALTEKLSWLYRRRRFLKGKQEIRAPYRALLAALGSPHENLPPAIHVAGTNGKGSVVAYLKATLQAAGYNVHSYTSPHLVRYNERIVLSGREIDDLYLESLLDRVFSHIDRDSDLDFFEITTALAFTAFAENPADIVLLETGLGGRLDCTNIITAPAASVITSVSYDHMEFLGNNLIDIAYEKAGIIKDGHPCFIGHQTEPDVRDFLREQAAQRGCPCAVAGRDWIAQQACHDRFYIRWRQSSEELTYPLPPLYGAHQIENAALALAVLKGCSGRFPVSGEAIATGLRNTVWPARLQKLECRLTPPEWELWLDSGHNESAGRILAAQAQAWQEKDGKPLYLMIGMMARKDIESFLALLAPCAAGLTAIPVHNVPGAAKPPDIAEIGRAYGIKDSIAARDIESGLRRIFTSNGKGRRRAEHGRILIAGSVYLAGEVLSYIADDKIGFRP